MGNSSRKRGIDSFCETKRESQAIKKSIKNNIYQSEKPQKPTESFKRVWHTLNIIGAIEIKYVFPILLPYN